MSSGLRAATAAPGTEEEVVDLVRAAAAAGTALATIGNGTKRHHGPAPHADATVVSLRHLSRISGHEPGDMVVTAQAGVRLGDLQKTLARHGQWLPIDPPYADATIGGILATASAGPRRLAYGGVKDLLLGLRVVGPTGVVTKSGGRVVKNVTGYDLHKVHVGAFGSLGVILEAHLKVRPRPEISGAVLIGCADLEAAHKLLLEVWGGTLRPAALEALSPGAGPGLRGLVPGISAAQALAVVGIEGSRLVFERHLRDLQPLRGRGTSGAVLRGPGAEALWTAFRDVPDRREVAVRIGARPHDLPELLRAVTAAGALVHVHAASGVARATLRRAPATELAALIAGWHERAAARGGYALVESAPLDLDGRSELPWGAPRHALGRALKQAWDPARTLNPGRMAL